MCVRVFVRVVMCLGPCINIFKDISFMWCELESYFFTYNISVNSVC